MYRFHFVISSALLMMFIPFTAGALSVIHDGALSDTNIRYIGRWDRRNMNVYHSYWGGAYLRIRFTGSSIGIRLAGETGLVISIDGESPRGITAEEGVTALNTSPLSAGVHSLLVGSSGQNFEVCFEGLVLAAGAKTLPASDLPIVEFIGDSITTGGGPANIYTVNYAWDAAEALGYDHTQIAFSARALTTGYGCAEDKTGLDKQYFRLMNFNHSDTDPWSFSYAPALVVINLGQNDQCGNESADVFTASYTHFLHAIRTKLPKAQIVAMRPFSGAYADAIFQAVHSVTASGDHHVHYVDTSDWLKKSDFLDGIHPNDQGNIKVARMLAPILKRLLSSSPRPKNNLQGNKVSVITDKNAADSIIVGNPKNPASLAQEIQNAYNSGARNIVIHPGVYMLPRLGRTIFSLVNWKDAKLSAYDVTLILQDPDWGRDAFDLRDCINVTLQGPVLSQNVITSYQGRVIAVGKDTDGKTWCDWKPDKGYPSPPATAATFPGGANVVDSHTRMLKIGNGDYWSPPMNSLGNGVFRLRFSQPKLNFGTGDWIVGRYGNAPFKVFLDHSRDCTIKDVTMMRNGFAPLREDGGGGNHIVHCIWALGPRPEGASEEPLVTNAADGIHSTGANPGTDLEGCIFKGVFLDDCIAIHGSFLTIKSASGNSMIVESGYAGLHVGQPARISDNKGFFAQALVTSIHDNGDKTLTVTLDKSLGVPAGAKVSNPNEDGQGCKVIGCHLGDTRSRGILIKGSNCVIKNNEIVGCGMPAISLGPEYYWNEADYVWNAKVEGNTLRENGKQGYGGAAIFVHGDGAIGNRDIIIKNNQMISNYQGDIHIEWTDGTAISNNKIAGAFPWPSVVSKQSVISLENCRDVTLTGNLVENSLVYSPSLVTIGNNVSDIKNNDTAGIRAISSSKIAPKNHGKTGTNKT